MKVYKCDMCGKVEDGLGKMTNIILSHAGISEVNYPRNGRYQICKDCTNKLLKVLNAWADTKREVK
jgi:hypothetical protein